MNYTKTEENLLAEMSGWDIIDCHEHLYPESERLKSVPDVFLLVAHYTRHDLFSAGMDADACREGESGWGESRKVYESLYRPEIPLEKRWAIFKPYWQAIRHSSYARAAILTAKLVYGVDGINDQTYRLLSEKIAAGNTPGLYRRILTDRCRIRIALTQCGSTAVERPLVPVMPGFSLTVLRRRKNVEEAAAKADGSEPKTLDDYLALMETILDRWVAEGTVGIKLMSRFNLPPDRAAADEAYKALMAGRELVANRHEYEVLENYLTHRLIDLAARRNLVIAVHAGVFGDFRNVDAKHLLSLAPAHPQAKFDLYHLGMPSVRDTIVIAKNFPNVFLNLCWTHIVSQAQTCSGIDELLDQVPVNKVFAFGGDYRKPVEKVVGHLYMARENFARVFGARIDRGLISLDDAVHILKLWFWDNPLRVYDRLTASPVDASQ